VKTPAVRRLKLLVGSGSTPRTGVWLLPDRNGAQLVSLITMAEELGLDEVWLGDAGPGREPFSVMAAASQRTDRIRLGVGVTYPFTRPPALTLTTVLTVNELSEGRAVLGVGAGGSPALAPFDATADRPLSEVRRFLKLSRSVAGGQPASDDQPAAHAIGAGDHPLPVYVGARGSRLNQLASELADGAFVVGLPPFRYREVIGWARSLRPIEIALYPTVAFGPEAREYHRPELVRALADSPPAVRTRLGVDEVALQAAVTALAAGDRDPARALVTDALQEQLMLVGEPDDVGQRLAALAREHRPDSIGLAVVQPDMVAGIQDAARALAVMARQPA
jgi:5,10-methylenetetrahydromethanopterin reductase